MVLALIESLAAVSEELRQEYEEVTEGPHKGKFRLKVESAGGLVLEDVSGLKSALAAQAEKSREKAKELAQLKERYEGIEDPDAARTALEKVAKGTAGKPDVDAAVSNALKQAEAKHAAEIKKAQERVGLLNGEVSRLLIDAQGAAAIAKHGGAESVELLLPHLRSLAFVEEMQADDGKARFVARVKPADGSKGNRLTMKSGSTDPMGIDELVESDLKTRFPSAFSGSGASGGGTSGKDRPPNRSGAVDTSKMTPAQRLQFARERAGATGK